jgi:membrane-associated PAP2 superfamily phosphatase
MNKLLKWLLIAAAFAALLWIAVRIASGYLGAQ